MIMGDLFEGSSAGDLGNSQGKQLNDGDFDNCLRVERVALWKSAGKGRLCFKVELTVTEAVNDHEEGDRCEVFETLSGNDYPSYDREARGRFRKFLGALAGLEKASDIDTQITEKDAQVASSEAQPFTGMLVSANVTSKKSKDGTMRYPKTVFRPGRAGEVTQTKAVVPPPPVAAPAAPAKKDLSEAAGFFAHPSAPGIVYNAAGEMYEVASGKKVA
jgi:hypothetical protein